MVLSRSGRVYSSDDTSIQTAASPPGLLAGLSSSSSSSLYRWDATVVTLIRGIPLPLLLFTLAPVHAVDSLLKRLIAVSWGEWRVLSRFGVSEPVVIWGAPHSGASFNIIKGRASPLKRSKLLPPSQHLRRCNLISTLNKRDSVSYIGDILFLSCLNPTAPPSQHSILPRSASPREKHASRWCSGAGDSPFQLCADEETLGAKRPTKPLWARPKYVGKIITPQSNYSNPCSLALDLKILVRLKRISGGFTGAVELNLMLYLSFKKNTLPVDSPGRLQPLNRPIVSPSLLSMKEEDSQGFRDV